MTQHSLLKAIFSILLITNICLSYASENTVEYFDSSYFKTIEWDATTAPADTVFTTYGFNYADTNGTYTCSYILPTALHFHQVLEWNGQKVLSSFGDGLWVEDNYRWMHFSTRNSEMENDTVRNIYVGPHTNKLYVSTAKHVFVLNGKKLELFTNKEFYLAGKVLEMADGTVWIGDAEFENYYTDKGMVQAFDAKGNHQRTYNYANSNGFQAVKDDSFYTKWPYEVADFIEMENGEILVAFRGHVGVRLYNRDNDTWSESLLKGQFPESTYQHVQSGMISTYRAFLDSQSRIWITTIEGTYTYIDGEIAKSSDQTIRVFEDRKGNIVGYTKGTYTQTSSTFFKLFDEYSQTWLDEEDLPDAKPQFNWFWKYTSNTSRGLCNVTDIYFDKENTAWITAAEQFYKYSQPFAVVPDVPDEDVYFDYHDGYIQNYFFWEYTPFNCLIWENVSIKPLGDPNKVLMFIPEHNSLYRYDYSKTPYYNLLHNRTQVNGKHKNYKMHQSEDGTIHILSTYGGKLEVWVVSPSDKARQIQLGDIGEDCQFMSSAGEHFSYDKHGNLWLQMATNALILSDTVTVVDCQRPYTDQNGDIWCNKSKYDYATNSFIDSSKEGTSFTQSNGDKWQFKTDGIYRNGELTDMSSEVADIYDRLYRFPAEGDDGKMYYATSTSICVYDDEEWQNIDWIHFTHTVVDFSADSSGALKFVTVPSKWDYVYYDYIKTYIFDIDTNLTVLKSWGSHAPYTDTINGIDYYASFNYSSEFYADWNDSLNDLDIVSPNIIYLENGEIRYKGIDNLCTGYNHQIVNDTLLWSWKSAFRRPFKPQLGSFVAEDTVNTEPETNDSVTSKLTEQKTQMYIYPNPAQNCIYISTNEKYGTKYTIYTAQGTGVMSGSVGSNKINISKLSKGVYCIQLNGEYIWFSKE